MPLPKLFFSFQRLIDKSKHVSPVVPLMWTSVTAALVGRTPQAKSRYTSTSCRIIAASSWTADSWVWKKTKKFYIEQMWPHLLPRSKPMQKKHFKSQKATKRPAFYLLLQSWFGFLRIKCRVSHHKGSDEQLYGILLPVSHCLKKHTTYNKQTNCPLFLNKMHYVTPPLNIHP